jgi:DnaJ-domain-containing protein 1
MLILRSDQIRLVTEMRFVLSNSSRGGLMARGSKKKYTSKQKRKAHDIEKGYKKRGVSSKEAERRAWRQ